MEKILLGLLQVHLAATRFMRSLAACRFFTPDLLGEQPAKTGAARVMSTYGRDTSAPATDSVTPPGNHGAASNRPERNWLEAVPAISSEAARIAPAAHRHR